MPLVFYLLFPEFPFIDRVGLVFLASVVLAVITSVVEGNRDQENSVDLQDVNFSITTGYNLAALGVILILIGLYATWW